MITASALAEKSEARDWIDWLRSCDLMLRYETIDWLSASILIDHTTSAIVTIVPRTAAETSIQIELISSSTSSKTAQSGVVVEEYRKRLEQDIVGRINRSVPYAEVGRSSLKQGIIAPCSL
jgi:hypothetical protein